MGSFGGHALPGSFFMMFGLWYVIQSFRRYFQCRQNIERYKSTVTFPCSCLCGRLKTWPLEAMLRLFVVTVGAGIEITYGFGGGKFLYMGNAQHATMYFVFGVAAIIDILLHVGAPLPPNIDYICNALAFTVEGLLFKFHLYGRTPLDVLVHTLLLYVVIATVICIFVEMAYRRSLLCPLARGFFLMVQGTWFWHVGNILYPKFGDVWDEHNHEQLMIATLFFTWHGAVNFVAILLIGGVTAFMYRQKAGYRGRDMNMKRLMNMSEPSNQEDSGSELELQKP